MTLSGWKGTDQERSSLMLPWPMWKTLPMPAAW